MQNVSFASISEESKSTMYVYMMGSTLHFTHFNYETRNKLSSLPLASEKHTKKVKWNKERNEYSTQHYHKLCKLPSIYFFSKWISVQNATIPDFLMFTVLTMKWNKACKITLGLPICIKMRN